MKAKIKIFGKLNDDKTVELIREAHNFYYLMDIEIMGRTYSIAVEKKEGKLISFERTKPNVESNSTIS